MEPDPEIFLSALRREVLSENPFQMDVNNPNARAILLRTAECLAQVEFRCTSFPHVLQEFSRDHVKILNDLVAHLHNHSAAVPSSIVDLLPLSSAEGELYDVEAYDRISAALSDGIKTLYDCVCHNAGSASAFWDICSRISDFEIKLHATIAEHLDRIKDGGHAPDQIAGGGNDPTDESLSAYLREQLPDAEKFQVRNARRVVGINSKDIFFFTIEGLAELGGEYVMRREPPYNVTEAILADEEGLLRHLADNGLPVARVLLGEGDPSHFGGGFIITECVAGSPRSKDTLGPNAREILRELAGISARLHQVSIPRDLPQSQGWALSTRGRMLERIEWYYAKWLKERPEPSPIFEIARLWLITNVSCLDDRTVLSHGDYNLRNILIDQDNVSCVLDWELCTLSHPAEDVSYIKNDVVSNMDWNEYLQAYQAASGFTISDASLTYFEVWSYFWRVVIASSSYIVAKNKSHRNFVAATIASHEYPHQLLDLAKLIKENPSLPVADYQ